MAMLDNKNAIAHVVTDEVRNQISTKKKRMKWIHNKKTREEFQIEVGEEMITGFQFGRLSENLRKLGPTKNRLDIAKMSDDERARLPVFVLNTLQKIQQEKDNAGS
jgi:hypothetical protein